jgi:hypothetical protein
MSILSNIDTFWFLTSLCVGLLLVYCTTPTPDIIIKYPTPFNAHKLVFEDDVNNCYRFHTHEVSCPRAKDISSFPIQRVRE